MKLCFSWTLFHGWPSANQRSSVRIGLSSTQRFLLFFENEGCNLQFIDACINKMKHLVRIAREGYTGSLLLSSTTPSTSQLSYVLCKAYSELWGSLVYCGSF